ncbi:MAG: pyruvate dehydrogenase (acetyl-transferring) E1 component subunit alpha [Nanoarchaeota archaeon]
MPRTQDPDNYNIEYVQILDEQGRVDGALNPHPHFLSDERIIFMYRTMVLCRMFDEKAVKLQRRGATSTYALIRGQEAAQVASAMATDAADWIFPSYREICVFIAKGIPIHQFWTYFMGDVKGTTPPSTFHMSPVQIAVATQIGHGAGCAWGAQLSSNPIGVITYFGEGATSEADFHEGMNFAGVFNLPCVFFCQNNKWAISVPLSQQTHSRSIAAKGIAYGVRSIQVDGNDPLGVYSVTGEALARAREGKGSTLIEALTHRMGDHTTSDDQTRYRTLDEIKSGESRDPIRRLRIYLTDRGLWDDGKEESLHAELEAHIKAEQEAALAIPKPEALEIFDNVYDKPTATLLEQRDELTAFRAWLGGSK